MADLSIWAYDIGTVSVNNGSTAVAGAGTNWAAAGLESGDILVVNGLEQRIASVNSATSITLKNGWPGANAGGVGYYIARIPDAQRVMEWARRMISAVESGGLSAMADLVGAANKLAYYTGPSTMATTDITAAARAILALTGSAGAKIPVVTAAGAAALRDIVGTVSQTGGIPTGAVMQTGSSATGTWTRWADGTQICRHTATLVYLNGECVRYTWTYPAVFIAPPTTAYTPSIVSAIDYATRTNWGIGGGAGANTTTAIFDQYRITGAPAIAPTTTISASLTAIGRWF